GRLNAFAVLAFWAEMTRLPGHWSPRSEPVKATAQTTPSRFTMVPHMSRLKPPLAWFLAWIKAARNAACDGKLRQASLTVTLALARVRLLVSARPHRVVNRIFLIFPPELCDCFQLFPDVGSDYQKEGLNAA